MKTVRVILIIVGFISVLFVSSGTASARSRFFLGFGTSIGHHHSSFHRGHYSHYGRHGGHYNWLGGGHYYSRSYYPSWYSCSSGTSVYIESRSPVYVARPVVVETRRVVIDSGVIVEPRRYEYKPANTELFEKVRNKKSELLKVLKIGDKAGRIKAISELAGYTFDNNVRKALEELILTDPDPELRKQVAESLGKVKNMSLIPILEKVRVEDADVEVRVQADRAIEKIKAY